MLKNILVIILFAALASVATAQCPGPATRTSLINLQKSTTVEGSKAGQIPLTDACGNQRYAQYVEVDLVPITYVPAPTGNTQNYSEFVTTTGGDIYYIDWQGRSIKLYTSGGGGGGDKDWLEIGNNQIPDNINDSIYTYKYAAVGARLVWPGAEFLVSDSINSGLQVISGKRQAAIALWDNQNLTWTKLEQGGQAATLYVQKGNDFYISAATGGTPQSPTTPIIDHFIVKTGDSTIVFPQYPSTRIDTTPAENYLYTDANGVIRSRPATDYARNLLYEYASGGGVPPAITGDPNGPLYGYNYNAGEYWWWDFITSSWLDYPPFNGVTTSGPLTGSGLPINPLTVLNGSINDTYVPSAGLSLDRLKQSGASTGQVPVWNGSVWAPGMPLRPDTLGLPEIKEWIPAVGATANENVTNYAPGSIDAVRYPFSATSIGGGGEYGGWLANGISGDSVRITAPFGVVIGDSQAEGHRNLHGRLHPRANIFNWAYPDSIGQLSYHLRALTNMRWYNHGIGGEQSGATRQRFYRDVLGVTSNVADGRGSQTLSRKAAVVIVITGINDAFAATTTQETIDNLKWIAATANQYGVKCVILNLPGDEVMSQSIAQKIETINYFLNNGGLNPYNAVVVDYMSWWKEKTTNVINNGNVWIDDDIHPTKVGYDSLANYIYRKANLPILSKLEVDCRIAAGFTGYSRPTNITINGVAKNVTKALDTIAITNYVPDSVWIKINSSTNVSGTLYSGFSGFKWLFTNNPNNVKFYTAPKYYGAGPNGQQDVNSVKIQSESFTGADRFSILYADRVNKAFNINVGGAVTVDVGYGATFTNSEIFRVHGTIGSSLGAKLGNFQIQNTGSASATGAGITAAIEGLQVQWGNNGLVFRNWAGATGTASWTSTNKTDVMFLNGFGGTITANGLAGRYMSIAPTYNLTLSGGVTNATLFGISYEPTATSIPAGIKHIAYTNTIGSNYFNTAGGNTAIGISTSGSISARLHIAAGTAGAGTAPIKLTSGTILTTQEPGAIEYDGTNFYGTNSINRGEFLLGNTASGTLDFPSTAAATISDITVTVTGAAPGDPVSIGVPNASVPAGGCFTAWVSATNTVTIRFANNTLSALDPASGTFKVKVFK